MGGEKDLPLNKRKSKTNVTLDIFMMFDFGRKNVKKLCKFSRAKSHKAA